MSGEIAGANLDNGQVFSGLEINLGEVIDNYGSEKIVYRGKIGVSGKPVVVKIARKTVGGDHVLPVGKINELIYGEVSATKRLNQLIPRHVPLVMGIYKEGDELGYVVEEILGKPLAGKDTVKKLLSPPSVRQWNEFKEAVTALAERGIFVNPDSLRKHNLMLGHTEVDLEERVIMAEPQFGDKDTDYANKFWVKRSLEWFEEEFPEYAEK